ncbi:pyrimidine utilization protein D [Sphingomonas bacterium]|uniref:pyrimidine utilization protein D n=1 Tax=Sphingomonas bacterium TaxID=1895847 RepID=UPI0015751246|nr:pyrimidine utilization protein D [Sphingomonas bacterium]
MGEAAGLYYERRGPRNGTPLILSPGLGGSASYWQPNVAALAERHDVIGYDHRGTGRSSRDVAGVLTIETMGDDIAALMDATGIERATVIGHAIGGMAGLALALAHPDRVERLVVVNGWATLDPYTARCFDTRLTLLRSAGPRAYLRAQPIFLYPPQWISEHDDAMEAEVEAQLATMPTPDMIERRIAAARRFDVADRLRALSVATLLVASDDDALVPCACSERLKAAAGGDVQLARMAHGGHACNVTRAGHFNLWLLDWLDG